jgi:hypothetical protein
MSVRNSRETIQVGGVTQKLEPHSMRLFLRSIDSAGKASDRLRGGS